MSDHPVLIPTSLGPVGGVVSEPEGERRGAAILLQGAGRPARSGVNSFWTRTARDLAGRGVVALRFDYAAEGESTEVGAGEHAALKTTLTSGPRGRAELDLHLLGEIVPWFRTQLDGIDPFLAGSCQGARMAIEFAAKAGSPVPPTFLIAPYLRKPDVTASKPAARPGWLRRAHHPSPDPIDPLVVSCLEATLGQAPSWILVGERDEPDISLLLDRLGPAAAGLELEIVPGAALHLLDQPDIQAEARRWLMSRVTRALTDTPVRQLN